MIKNATTEASSTGWYIQDNMRGMSVTGDNGVLYANLSSAEAQKGSHIAPTATGFTCTASDADFNSSGVTYIYIAIRRGPMKVPTTGTSVFTPISVSNSTGTANTTNFPIDLQFASNSDAVHETNVMDRLRGVITTNTDAASPYLATQTTGAEKTTFAGYSRNWGNTGFATGSSYSGLQMSYWNFRRAPGTFDEVCYTGTGTSGRAIPHNLAAVPELIICKQRSSSSGTRNWIVYAQPLGSSKYLYLNDTAAAGTVSNIWGTQTATTFGVENFAEENDSGQTFVAYLWATNPGVTKVGTYTGNGSSQTINCGFTSGARFVMIKAVSTTGNWLVADSARGIVAGNDPALYLNSTAAEVTGFDWIDADSTGFVVNETATIAANTNGVQYIYLSYA
jgi:hypothetical protein